MLISTSAVGLPTNGRGIFVACARLNNWCQGDCDFSQQPQLKLSPDGKFYKIGAEVYSFKNKEQFKLIIPNFGAERAAVAYAARMDADRDTLTGQHIDRRFDYDPNTGHFWLLACNHRVTRKGYWNQNNVYSETPLA